VNGERTKPVTKPQLSSINATSGAKTEAVLPDRKRGDDESMTSSTDGAAAATTSGDRGGVAPTRPTGNGSDSIEEDLDARERTKDSAGKPVSSLTDVKTKSTARTKHSGRGILARGQKLLKQLKPHDRK